MPILLPNVLDFISRSLEQTTRLGARLGELALPGDVIALSGELGAGKTAFASGFGLGFGAREPVTSPTFVFAHEHRRATDSVRLYHMDCYRLSGAVDADSIGLSDMLAGDAVLLIEWPERILPLLPAERLWITLEAMDDEPTRRRIEFQATGTRPEALLDTFRRRAFGG
jgi:tRNA threonylcarbamoyladenosine biosynthesis protein TsaE